MTSTPYFKHQFRGWRSAAIINTYLVSILLVTLSIILAIAYTHSEEDGHATVIFTAPCSTEKADTANTVFHFVINVFSTAILASSNFFMQVLNSPTRGELDKAHNKGSWLDIGVPSVRNVFKVSKTRTACWAFFLLSSVPIHLFFNSAVFAIDYRGALFNLTVVAEPFLIGSPGYWPGAASTYDLALFYKPRNITSFGDHLPLESGNRLLAWQRQQSIQWKQIDVDTCRTLYFNGTGVHAYRDVILVVDKDDGWLRSQLWDLSPNSSTQWEPYVPANKPNFLFAYDNCSMYARHQYDFSTNKTMASLRLINSCVINIQLQKHSNIMSWNYQYQEKFYPPGESNPFSMFQKQFSNNTLKYCLVEPNDEQCRIGLSTLLLSMVVVFVLIKVVLCLLVIRFQSEAPLVTLGDVIESNICDPSTITRGLCLLKQSVFQQKSNIKTGAAVPSPRAWIIHPKRRFSAVPISVWVSSYALFVLGITVVIYFLRLNQLSSGGLTGKFGPDPVNPIIGLVSGLPFIATVLVVNSPQVFLSFCYITFNNLFTRMQMAEEWAAFSKKHTPLRVSNPKGNQISTYRLQLPYKYSVPLILASILLHWTLSNTLYLTLSVGNYYYPLELENIQLYKAGASESDVPFNAFLAVAYSSWALVVLLVVSCGLICVPIATGIFRLPENSIVVGSNSFAIAASCHISPLSRIDDMAEDVKSNDVESAPGPEQLLFTQESTHTSILDMESASREHLAKISQCELKWGEVSVPKGWPLRDSDDLEENAASVGHISFGTKMDEVSVPEEGRLYA